MSELPEAASARPSVLILSRDAPAYLEELSQLPVRAFTSVEAACAAHADEPILLAEPGLAAAALLHMPKVRWVQSTWAGIVRLLPAAERGVQVTGVKGVFGPAMAEYCLARMLAHAQDLDGRKASARARRWDRCAPASLKGLRLGIMGTGSIGVHVAHVAAAFGMELVGLSRSGEARAPFARVYPVSELHAFAAELDYLIAALPHTPATARLLDAEALARLPPRCYLINVGRGSLIDEAALANALRAGQLAGAALDVFEREPLPDDHFLWDTPRLSITAHVAALSKPADIAALFMTNYRRYCAAEPLAHRVDPMRGY